MYNCIMLQQLLLNIVASSEISACQKEEHGHTNSSTDHGYWKFLIGHVSNDFFSVRMKMMKPRFVAPCNLGLSQLVDCLPP